MSTLERPTASGQNARGIPIYDGPAVNAYRMARGVKVDEVARHLRVTQSYVSQYLNGRYELQEKMAGQILRAVDALGDERDVMRAEGMARLAGVVERDGRRRVTKGRRGEVVEHVR